MTELKIYRCDRCEQEFKEPTFAVLPYLTGNIGGTMQLCQPCEASFRAWRKGTEILKEQTVKVVP